MSINFFKKLFGRSRRSGEINPDEIFLDSHNLPHFDVHQFEGRLEKPISSRTFAITATVFILIGLSLLTKTYILQGPRGEVLAQQSSNNRLNLSFIFSQRGAIYDREGGLLAWNTTEDANDAYLKRKYATTTGSAHIVGYLKYPKRDKHGFFYNTEYSGMDGVEKSYDDTVAGGHGLRILETDALGEVISASTIRKPEDGENINLTVDSRLQHRMYEMIRDTASDYNYRGGSGVIMDIRTGELIVMSSFPEYDPQALTEGDEEKLGRYQNDERTPFLNRAVAGLYTPGSIIKPFIAAGVLAEGIISPNKEILSTGSIAIPNPWDEDKETVFPDWKAHGLVDMRKALAVSSNVYFFIVGGGFEGQQGLGISGIEKYARMFGFGEPTGINLPSEKSGVIPNPEWKAENFDGDIWRIGDTYNTSIGQYGFQVTPVQAVRATAAIANGGRLLTPTLVKGSDGQQSERIDIDAGALATVREGMRQAVTDGTASGLGVPGISVAAKTGTAETGNMINSWVTGFFPYEEPRYAFTVVMERGPRTNVTGGVYVMSRLLRWMRDNTPEYVK